jgi:hypothetical protein
MASDMCELLHQRYEDGRLRPLMPGLAAICGACVTLVSRGSRWAAQLCQLCAEICEACAAECDKHDNDHCRACAESSRRCAQECRARPDQHLKLSRTSAVQRSGSCEQCHGHGRAVVVLDSLVGLRRFGHRIAPPRPVNPSPARPRPTALQARALLPNLTQLFGGVNVPARRCGAELHSVAAATANAVAISSLVLPSADN